MAQKLLGLPRYITIILICGICIVPFYILLVLSLNAPTRVFHEGNLLIPSFAFSNYAEAWGRSNIARAILNSLIITGGSLGLLVLCGAMAGYAVARFPNRINNFIFVTLIACMMIPGIINTVPLYSLMRRLHAVNTLWGMVLVCTTLSLPTAVFIFRNYVKSIPLEIEEAAVVDGCSRFGTFWRVTLPLLKPAASAVCILTGFGIWNNYAQAVFFLQSSNKHNIPQAISVFFQQFSGTQWHLLSATAVIAIIPVVAIFIIFQKQFMRGLTDGAVKG